MGESPDRCGCIPGSKLSSLAIWTVCLDNTDRTLRMGLDSYDGGRICLHHVSKVPSFTCLQLPCPHTVFSSICWDHQWFSGASSTLGYLFFFWASAAEGLSHALPYHSLEVSFLHAGFEDPCSAILRFMYDTVHCPRKLIPVLLKNICGFCCSLNQARVIEDVCNRKASGSREPGHAQVPGHPPFFPTLGVPRPCPLPH